MTLKEFQDQLCGCKACGTCGYGRGPNFPWVDVETSPYRKCPSIEKFHFLSYSARGRLYLADAVCRGNLSITDEIAKIFYTCTNCGTCEELCFQPFNDIFRAMREEIVKKNLGPPAPNRLVDDKIKNMHNPFGRKVEERIKLANELNLPKKGDDLYFTGCYVPFKQADIASALMTILKAAGLNLAYLAGNEWCCGLHSGWDGQTSIETEMARHNVEVIKASGAKRVIFSCPGCYGTFKKDYPKIIGTLPFEVVHAIPLVAELVDKSKIKFKRRSVKLTYHDPCHLGRHMGIYNEPRKILTSIPGVELVEMERSGRFSWCCGGGAGVVYNAYRNFAYWCANERLAEAGQVANNLVTSCPLCLDSFSAAKKRARSSISLSDLLVFAAESLEF